MFYKKALNYLTSNAMNQAQLYPTDVIESSVESFLSETTTRSQVIYMSALLAVLGALAALPFVHVDVSVQSRGVVRPVAEKTEIRPLVAGMVAEVLVRENEAVRIGQPLVRLRTDLPDSKLRLNRTQQTARQLVIRDIERLVKTDRANLLNVSGLQSPLVRQQFEQLRLQLSEAAHTRQKRQQELAVARQLYNDKVIARQEFEEKEYNEKMASAQLASQVERQLSEWQNTLTQQRLDLDELRAQERQLDSERQLHTITASVAGTVGQLAGRYPGSYVQPGEVLGVISPDSNLVVECYVSPKDIGLLRPGMTTRMQIDAFNYNQWGMAEGTILSISNDIVVMDNQPVFRVKCRLNQNYLALDTGYRGYLKKGMTLGARFIVTRRTLFQLIYDKTDDWLNPGAGNFE